LCFASFPGCRRYPSLPSHYIYTACSIYKSFRKLRRRGLAKAEKPFFKKQVIMLDDRLFSLNLEGWEASIAVEGGRAKLKLLHGTYHEKFKEMKFGQAWLVKMPFIRRLYSPRPLSL
jgi:putative transposase